MIRPALAVLACAAFASVAQAGETAATLGAVKGDVVVAGGKGIASAKPGAALRPGDRIVARTGSAALRYADGCSVTLKPGAMATIDAQSPCAGGAGVITAGLSSAQLGLPKWPIGGYVAGAGVVVIAGAIAYGLTDPLKEDPVSE